MAKKAKGKSPQSRTKKAAAAQPLRILVRRQAPETKRTAMGLVGRRSVTRSRRLENLVNDNYKPLPEAAWLKAWFPAFAPQAKKKVVVLTAHDDDLITFSGTLAKLAQEDNAEIHHLILTDGSMGCGDEAMRRFISKKEFRKLKESLVVRRNPRKDPGHYVAGKEKALNEYAKLLRKAGEYTARIRQEEAREAERILGWHATYFLNFQDAALGQYHFGITDYRALGVTALALRLVREIEPDLMILQDRTQVIDFNPDHYAAGSIGYTIYWHLHCPVLGVDGMDKPFKALIQRGFEGIGRPEFRLCDYLVHLNDTYLRLKLESLYAYKNQMELVNDLFKVEEMEKFRVEGFFEIDLPPATF